MKNLLRPFLVLAVILASVVSYSCKKPPGEGGKASIKGSIWVEDWNSGFTVKNGEYAGADQDVYIVYGDEVGYSDKTTTDYNGEFEFRYLRKGKYKIYVYSKDKTLTSPSGETSVVKEVEITGKKQSITLERITIYN